MVERIGFYSRDETYGWLSNFHRSDQDVDGVIYKTNEHYYQSKKAISLEFQNWIRLAPNPYHAMMAGRTLREGKTGELRPDWERVKLNIMLEGLRAKFDNPILKQKLLDTGDSYLFEKSPNDTYWGVVNGRGNNHLGILIMQVRGELKV